MKPTPWTTKDWYLLAALISFAGLLRCWNLESLGLTHFDEGSYAMTGKWLATFGREGWTYQSGHAPGLFPTLIGCFFFLFGIRDYVAIAVAAMAGTTTVGICYWIGRTWFSRPVAVMAALFLATAEYHLMFSRLALTDALFTGLFWAALAAYFLALESGKKRWFILAGVLTGLCWNTKYHGFLPIILVAGWLATQIIIKTKEGFGKALATTPLRPFLLSVVIAVALYAPWFLAVQFTVGYDQILQHQLGHSLTRNLPATDLGVIWFYLRKWLSPALLLFACFGAATCMKPARPTRFILYVTVAMVGAALLYLSFPRLLLPALPGICLLAAVGISVLPQKLPGWQMVAQAAPATIVLAWNLTGALPSLAIETTAYREAANYLKVRDEPILSQLSKNFYFYEQHKSIEMRRQTIAELDSILAAHDSLLLVVDPIVHRFPELTAWLEARMSMFRLEKALDIRMYEPNYFQGFDPRQLTDLPRTTAPFTPGSSQIAIFIHDTSDTVELLRKSAAPVAADGGRRVRR